MADVKKEDGAKGKVFVHVLVALVGVTSWSIMNGLWVELPILVAHLPEGWTLPSYLTIISQFGNLGPLTFVFLTWLFPKTKLETPVSIVVVIALSLCAALYGFLWQETATIGGVHFSVAILVLTLCQAIFAATSSMSYLAFMSHLKARYISSIFIGQGLSGLLPAFIAIGQGAGDVRCITNHSDLLQGDHSSSINDPHVLSNETSGTATATVTAVNTDPRFSVQAFFMILFSMGLVSLVSLIVLVRHPYCRTEHVDVDEEEHCQLMATNKDGQENGENKRPTSKSEEESQLYNVNYESKDFQHTEVKKRGDESAATDDDVDQNRVPDVMFSELRGQGQSEKLLETQSPVLNGADRPLQGTDVKLEAGEAAENEGQGRKSMKRWESWYLLGLLVWINVLQTSYVLAIQVYSSLPYGLPIYNGVTKAENIVDPLACVVTLFVTAQRTKVISGLTLLGTLFAAYIITVAAMSPHPFLVNETMGGVLVIAAWVMCTVLMVYSKVSIASVMRNQGRKSLIWTGGSSQLGALIGAILAYVMINQLDLFKDGPWC